MRKKKQKTKNNNLQRGVFVQKKFFRIYLKPKCSRPLSLKTNNSTFCLSVLAREPSSKSAHPISWTLGLVNRPSAPFTIFLVGYMGLAPYASQTI